MNLIDTTNAAGPVATFTGGTGGVWENPGTFKEWRDMADVIASAGAAAGVAGDLIGNSDAVIVRMIHAQALNIPIGLALTDLYTQGGRIGMSAALMRALMLRAGHGFELIELNNLQCVMGFQRSEWVAEGRVERVSWHIDEAELAGLLRKDWWLHYKQDMLFARCTSRGARRWMTDVIKGFGYTREELAEVTDDRNRLPEHLSGIVEDLVRRADAATTSNELVAVAQAAQTEHVVNQLTSEFGPGSGRMLRVYLSQRWNDLNADAPADSPDVEAAERPTGDAAPPGPAPARDAEPETGSGDDSGELMRCEGGCTRVEFIANGDHRSGCPSRMSPAPDRTKKEQTRV